MTAVYTAFSFLSGQLPLSIISINTAMNVNCAYVTNAVGTVQILLPTIATSQPGDIFFAANFGAGNFQITQAANQNQAIIGGAPSTTGVGGSVASTNQYSSLVGVFLGDPNSTGTSTWLLTQLVGNYTVV